MQVELSFFPSQTANVVPLQLLLYLFDERPDFVAKVQPSATQVVMRQQRHPKKNSNREKAEHYGKCPGKRKLLRQTKFWRGEPRIFFNILI